MGSHSKTHPEDISSLSSEELGEEVKGSRVQLEATFERPVRFFAYPHGGVRQFTRDIISAIKKAGYWGACINMLGAVRAGDDPFTLRRVRIESTDTLRRFTWKLSGECDWVDHVRYGGRTAAADHNQAC